MIARLIVETLLDGPPDTWLPPELPPPVAYQPDHDPVLDTQDLALEYIEGEVGRLDWEHNWPQHKKLHGDALKEKVAAWLHCFNISHDPQAIIDYIDNELTKRPGKWL
jgi:hypothetical protein